jgi:hypothetical protein
MSWRDYLPEFTQRSEAAVELLISCQDVDFTKLFLYLLDTLDAPGAFVSVVLGHDDRPALIARYNRNLD